MARSPGANWWLGFDAPESGGKHQYMLGRGKRVILPNPHHDELRRAFVPRILDESGVSREEWEAL